MCYVICTRLTICIPDQKMRKQDGVHLSDIQMVFKYQTIWHPTSFDHLNTELVWYSDPHCITFYCVFQLFTDDEIQVTADHLVRPIMVPRDIHILPWFAGYAEAINAGKSLRNEDQVTFWILLL